MTPASEELLHSTDEVNRAQREYWETEGPRQYQHFGETSEAQNAPFGQAMLDAARLQPGERVLDVGCGYGASTFEAAERVTPSGRVLGVDISAAMLEPARQRAATAGINNVELLRADAQTHPFEAGSFDAVISRFGMMFFEHPRAAFANLANALRTGGRLVFVCPRDPLESEWIAVALGAAVATLGYEPDLSAPGGPGTFALADGERLAQLLTIGGFRDVTLEAISREVPLGQTIDDAVSLILSLPESKRLLAGAAQQTIDAAAAALRSAFTPFAGPHGVVAGETAWLVSARR